MTNAPPAIFFSFLFSSSSSRTSFREHASAKREKSALKCSSAFVLVLLLCLMQRDECGSVDKCSLVIRKCSPRFYLKLQAVNITNGRCRAIFFLLKSKKILHGKQEAYVRWCFRQKPYQRATAASRGKNNYEKYIFAQVKRSERECISVCTFVH